MPRSACASAQSDQGLHCLLTESMDTTECLKGPDYIFAHAQNNLNLCILHMLEGPFLLDMALMIHIHRDVTLAIHLGPVVQN